MKILVVDDERDVQRLFEQRFRKERRSGKIELFFAFSAQEAISFLQSDEHNDLTLVLSDINMPKMSGLELLQIVRTQYPALRVYMITAYGDEQNRQRALELGASEYLTKPLDFSILKEKILS